MDIAGLVWIRSTMIEQFLLVRTTATNSLCAPLLSYEHWSDKAPAYEELLSVWVSVEGSRGSGSQGIAETAAIVGMCFRTLKNGVNRLAR